MTPWKAGYLPNEVVGPRGWYATRRTAGPIPAGHGMMCSIRGPFDTEAECQAWCDRENGVAVADEPVTAEARP